MRRTHGLDATVASATEILRQTHPRLGAYAYDVLDGHQRWSGADLKGQAKRYGASYHEARCHAAGALHRAGGEIVAVEHGRLVTAVAVGTDDCGSTIYQTAEGPAIPHTAAQCRVLRWGEV